MTKDERLSRVCDLLFKINREEILRDGDWWYGADHYDFNFFDWGGTPYHVNVTVYDMTGKYFQYSEEQQVFSKEIFIGERI